MNSASMCLSSSSPTPFPSHLPFSIPSISAGFLEIIIGVGNQSFTSHGGDQTG